jgi:hypothetical protein
MGKKGNLLTEGQVRKFMKLANLEAITPGFIYGLHEQDAPEKTEADRRPPGQSISQRATDAVESAMDRRPKAVPATIGPLGNAGEPGKSGTLVKEPRPLKDPSKKGVEESHGRGEDEGPAGYGKPDQNARLREQEDDDWDVEDAEDDLEHAEDLEVDAEEDLGDVGLEDELGLGPDEGGQQVSVDDFLAALEIALEDVLGDEVEVDQEEDVEVEDEEVELPLGGGEDLDVGLDVEEEPALQEMINQITRRVAKRIVKEALQGKK